MKRLLVISALILFSSVCFSQNNVQTFKTDSGGKYVGEVSNNLPNGKGIMYYANGNKEYEGMFKDGQFHGTGTSYFENGKLEYAGQWKEGYMDGYGEAYWENGFKCYEGTFKDGFFDGVGTFYREKDGTKKYAGEFKDEYPNGQGTFYYLDGKVEYTGQVKDDQPNGPGTSYYKSGSIEYTGTFSNGYRLDGHGTEYFDGGGKMYEGDFVNGIWEGQGVWYYQNGNIRAKGEFSKDLPCGQVVRYYENGVKKFEGTVALFTDEEGKTVSSAQGYGVWYDENGKPIKGGADYRTASYTCAATEGVAKMTARFATVEDDMASLAVNVEDKATTADGMFALDLGACVESLSLPKISVSGLPSGIKYDSKTLKISGKATKPGVYVVKVSAANTSVKNAIVQEFRITVPNLSCTVNRL